MNTDDLSGAIAIALNVERDAAGWTLEDLAKELGLSEQTLGRYLTRRTRSLPVDVLTRACAVIGVPVSEVIRSAERRVASRGPNSTAADIAAEARRRVRANEPPPPAEGERDTPKRGTA